MNVRENPPAPVGAGAGAFRQEILDALARLLLQSSLDDLRIAAILRAAKVSRGTFYFYYASKEDAFASLLDQVYARVVPSFEVLFGDAESRRSPGLRDAITTWLRFPASDAVVIRTAVEEWPRHPGIREIHLAAQRRLAAALTRVVDAERKAGTAVPGIPSATLASALIWTLERAWYEAGTSADSSHDLDAVSAALAATIESAIYGRSTRG